MFKFELTPVSDLPSNATILGADFSLYRVKNQNTQYKKLFTGFILGDWKEDEICYNNMPEIEYDTSGIYGLMIMDTDEGWHTMNADTLLSILLQGEINNNSVYGFCMMHLDNTDADLYSSETSDPAKRPKLTIFYSQGEPFVYRIPGQTIIRDQQFDTIYLNNYVKDPDNSDDEITWTASGNNINVNIDNVNKTASLTYPGTWVGKETIGFKATDPGGLSDTCSALFEVIKPLHPPVVSQIPDYTILKGQNFTLINLNDYVEDSINSDDQITWSVVGNSNIAVDISSGNIASFTVIDTSCVGIDNITFIATDPEGDSDSCTAAFTIVAFNVTPTSISEIIPLNYEKISKLTISNGNNFNINYTISLSIDGLSDNHFDKFGYMWNSSEMSSYPVYQWEDIKTTGTKLNVTSDKDGWVEVPLKFDFPYYGLDYSRVYVSPFGYVQLTNGFNDPHSLRLPADAAPQTVIAACWYGMWAENVDGGVYVKGDDKKFIVQYDNVHSSHTTGEYTFQIVLYKSGEINFYYKSILSDYSMVSTGIQNVEKNDGFCIAHNEEYIKDSMAIEIVPRWMTLDKYSGTARSNSNDTISVILSSAFFGEGIYDAELTLSYYKNYYSLKIPVTLEISSTVPVNENDITTENSYKISFTKANNGKIIYFLNSPGKVKFSLFAVNGKKIAENSEYGTIGRNISGWDIFSKISTGIYFVEFAVIGNDRKSSIVKRVR